MNDQELAEFLKGNHQPSEIFIISYVTNQDKKVHTVRQRADLVPMRIERLTSVGIKVLSIDKKKET